MGGPRCRLSILRNGNIPCRYFSNVPVEFRVVKCRLSNLRKRRVALWFLRLKGPKERRELDCKMQDIDAHTIDVFTPKR